MRQNSASGQILVLVLLVVLVGMSIGLSVAARTLSNQRDTTHLNQSNRAFSAAEAGIEVALSKLNTNPAACDSNCFDRSLSGVDSVQVTADPIGGSTKAFGLPNVKRDDIMQVNLEGYPNNGQVQIYWDNAADHGNCSNISAIVVSVIYENAGTYGMVKNALDKCAASRSNDFNSADALDVFSYTPAAGLKIQDDSVHNDYGYRTTLTLATMVPSGASVKLARIRLMYGNDAEQIAVAPVGGSILPNQGQQITSTATAGKNQRTVKVIRSNATLPAIFDYALFNGSTETLSK